MPKCADEKANEFFSYLVGYSLQERHCLQATILGLQKSVEDRDKTIQEQQDRLGELSDQMRQMRTCWNKDQEAICKRLEEGNLHAVQLLGRLSALNERMRVKPARRGTYGSCIV